MPALSHPIQCIVGLGNPGRQYEHTRHNAGSWFAEKLAAHHKIALRAEAKFKGLHGSFLHHDQRIHVLIPTTFMNLSGQSVVALSQFYHIAPENILIAHDELDLMTDDVRLKFGGGHGGHNGLRDIVSHLHTTHFYRLRIGIGHPGERDAVLDYVLSSPSKSDKKLIDTRLDDALAIVPYLLDGAPEKAMQILHSR